MNILVDTNRYRDFCEGKANAVDVVQRARTLAIPFVVLAELRAGFLCGTIARHNEQTLTRFLNSQRVQILFPDEDTTHHFARIFAQLRRQGTPIPVNDIWIAALAVQHDLILFTRDSHFDDLPQIARC
ncbi:MAG: type II toxin-antitoxin system VapC family toxin [Kiritimatiellia bacterium]